MKENFDIDEVLNCFIDGELTARQQTEVQRLILHDGQMAERLRQLERCRMLIGSLPRAEAPARTTEEIKASLERRTLLGVRAERFDERRGARHLLGRRLLAAAAMVGLVAVLGGVIYRIVAPEAVPGEKPVAVEALRQPTATVAVEDSGRGMVSSIEAPAVAAAESRLRFTGRLELETNNAEVLSAFVDKAIEANGLLSPMYQGGAGARCVVCSGEDMNMLLADLRRVWDKLESARLFVQAEPSGEQVVVDGVTIGQIAAILGQQDQQSSVKVAKDFAALNSVAKLVPGRELLSAVEQRGPELPTIPKPVLTSGEKTVRSRAGQAADKAEAEVCLTIVITGGGDRLPDEGSGI